MWSWKMNQLYLYVYGGPAYPLLLFLMKEFENGAKISRNNFMVFDYLLPEWLLNVHLRGLKRGLAV